MKRKLIISLLVCVLLLFAFTAVVSAQDSECDHSYKWTVDLGTDGFLGDVTASAKCEACGATNTEVIPKIFITLGYSYSDSGVMQSYGVNRDALKRYEELSGETVKFGAVVALSDTIGDKNPLDSEANPISDKVKSQDYTNSEYSIIKVSVKAIPDSNKDSSGVICALYINAGGRNTYIDNCAEKVNCGKKTYNEVKSVPEKDTTSLSKYKVIKGQRYHEMTATELGLVEGAYWNNRQSYSGDDTAKKFWATKGLTSEDLPNGTIIYLEKNEWQYRPHKFHSGTFKRPDTIKTEYVTIDDSWWADLDENGTYTTVGFNISYYESTSATNDVGKISKINGQYTADDILEIFKVFVPVDLTEDTTEDDTTGGETGGGTTGGETGGGTTGGETGGGTTGGDTGEDEEDDIVIPPSPDYSAVKQNWDDDGELKILAIGNSFSDDALEYVYQVATDAGIEKITVGKLYIGGCTLATHLANAKSGNSAYDYKINTAGSWVAQGNKSIQFAVESDDWDFITFQQASGYSGIADTYDDLVDLINIVEPLNPSARLAWHMTWAYKVGSGHADFPKYNNDQMTMYNAIVNAVNTKILTNDKIEIVIPSGTAVQNVRTSFIGDTTRDGYHLSYGIGRYIASMTFVKALTGLSIDNSVTRPDDVDSYELKAIIESVNNAINTPYAVTNSSYPTTQGGTGGDDSENVGVIPEGYVQLTATQMGLTFASFYNTSGTGSWEATDNSFARGFMATKKFTREELPAGSIIEIASGWQYRPEGWTYTGTRPGNVTTLRIVIDEDWWGSYTERAFNISQVAHTTSNNVAITLSTDEVASTIFKIIVPAEVAPDVDEPEIDPDTPSVDPDTPEVDDTTVYVKSSDCDSEVVVINGKEYRALSASAMGYQKNAYYYSSNKGAEIYESGTSGTPAKFFATKIFTKSDLPIGAVIWVNSGWQYRPEGWAYTGTRPGNVTTTYVTADESWWGTHTQKGFNISKTNGSALTSADYTAETIHENFKIYIPVENIAE
ncbi:MAG: DUF4886 domain-containing protein [Clostridia bacterium]|nr:DUF4886 domain-containing protein [Clostridia bacterium]